MQVEAGGQFARAAQKFGDRVALTTREGSRTFEALNRAAALIGSGISVFGARPGERVGVLSYNRPEVVEVWLGLEKHNLVRVVLHSHFDMAVHVNTLNQVGARSLVFDTRFNSAVESHRGDMKTVKSFIAIGPDVPHWATPYAEVAAAGSPTEPRIDVDENDPCFIQLTTGTTGIPKPWVATHRSWRTVNAFNLEHFDSFAPGIAALGPQDVNLHFHALQWATGFQTMLPYMLRGARTVILDDEEFDPTEVVNSMVREGVTGMFVPAPMLGPILDEIEARGSIAHKLTRVVVFFATPDFLERVTKVLGPVWCHGFGATEQGAPTTRLTCAEAAENPEHIASVGRNASPFFEVAIMNERGERLETREVGEIVVRSPMSSSRYWEMPEKTAESFFPGGWFRPFDIGYLDEDGFLFYLDRATDQVTTSGGVAYPHVVEIAILQHESVRNCGVVGIGAEGAQEVVAGVLLKQGIEGSPDLERAIIVTAKANLKPYECPSRVVFVDDLPTVLGGAKVQREVLRERLTVAPGGDS